MTPLFTKTTIAFAFFVGTLATAESHARYYDCSEQEYRCETRNEQQCGYEQRCTTVPGERVCSQERVCENRYVSPTCESVQECGTNAFGEPICKTREVCSGGGYVEECGYAEQCRDTDSRNECSNEYICDSRPVESCSYVSVPRQCYEPDPVTPTPVDPSPVYPTPVDPYPTYPAPIDPDPVYPTPTPTPIDPTPVEPSPIGIGPASVQNLRVTLGAQESVLTFKDLGQSLTYKTRYFITIYDARGDVLLNQYASEKGQNQKIILNQSLTPKKRYKLVVRVQRSGGELASDVIFTKALDF